MLKVNSELRVKENIISQNGQASKDPREKAQGCQRSRKTTGQKRRSFETKGIRNQDVKIN